MVVSFPAYYVNGYDIANLVFLAADCNYAFFIATATIYSIMILAD